MITRRPRALSRRPRLEAVSPLPRLEATPPVTKRCLVDAGRDEYDAAAKGRLPWSVRSGEAAGPRAIRISASRHQNLHQHPRLLRSTAGAEASSSQRGWRRPSSPALSSSMRAWLAFGGLPDRPPLRGGQPLLVRFAEPGQRHGAEDGKAEP